MVIVGNTEFFHGDIFPVVLEVVVDVQRDQGTGTVGEVHAQGYQDGVDFGSVIHEDGLGQSLVGPVEVLGPEEEEENAEGHKGQQAAQPGLFCDLPVRTTQKVKAPHL
jgi:hypothetical protein